MKKILPLIAVVSALILAACSSPAPSPDATTKATDAGAAGASGASGPVAIKTYPMHGKILVVTPADKTARIEAGPLGDWMGAMTMNYTIKDDAGFSRLAVGDTIDATVFVQGDDFWVGDIKSSK